MTVYIATPDLCHSEPSYEQEKLPVGWPDKKFTFREGGRDIVELLPEETPGELPRSWHITPELAATIRGRGPASEQQQGEAPSPHEAALKVKDAIIEELNVELERLRDQVSDQAEQHRTFKRRVGEVAMEYAERHDWCSTVAEALEDLGIEVPTKEYTFTLSVVYRVRGTKTSYGEPDTYSIDSGMYLDPDVTVRADDWEDFEVEYVQHDIMDIEEVQE